MKEGNVSFIKNEDKDIALTDESLNDMLNIISDFKYKLLEIENDEVSQEYKNVFDYLNNNNSSCSSFYDEFPNYVRYIGNFSSVKDSNGAFAVVKELSRIIK